MRLMAEFGSEALAGYTIAIRVMMFTFMPAWGMSNAAATLVGQNLGAKKPDRAEKSVWLTGRYNAYFMLLISIVYLIFAKPIVGLFTDVPSVIANGALCLQVVASGYVFYAYGMVVSQAFNGAGDTRTPTKINFIAFWLVQLPFAYLVSIYLDWGSLGVFIAIVLAEVLLSVMAILWFRKGYWKQTKV
jgi:Na+-driven multidrug efflux pump